MVNPRRKALAFFLACVMLLSLLPISALAADAEGIRMDVAEGNTPGSRCPDFTFTTYDGKEYNLYDTLAEKDMVLINLWATWCGPCQSEFPAMTEAYEQYKDKIEIFALSVEAEDTDDVLASYVAAMGMTFPVGMDTPDLGTYFRAMYIPTTIVVDRHGIICFSESGAQTSSAKFGALFDTFLADDYDEPVLLEGFPSVKPTVEPEDAAKLAAALGTAKSITVSNGEEADWPFVTASADGRTYLQSTNADMDETQAVLNATVTAKDGDALSFDYNVSSEYGYDFLELYVDGEPVKFFSGDTGWDTFAYALDAGTHEISFVYIKDMASGDGDDAACIDNLKVLSDTDAAKALDAMPVYPHGEVTSMRLTNEKAKPIQVNDDLGGLASFFNYSPSASYIVGSTTATFEFTLAEGVDPNSVLIESDYSGTSTLLSECFVQESEDDPGKFLYETYVDTVKLTDTPVTTVTVYYQQTGDIECYYLFYDMDAVTELDDLLTEYFGQDVMSVEEVPGKIDLSIPEGAEVGQRMPNFQFTDINGVEHDLYETLAEKDMVLINMWATWCGPCEMEFPFMEESYESHKDDIEIFALSCEPSDDAYTLTEYATSHGMTFPVGNDVAENGGPDLGTFLSIYAYPTSIAVDRYGRICFVEAGSQPSAAKFDQLFERFIGDDYANSVILETIPGPQFEGTRDDAAKISAAVNAAGSKLTVSNSEDEDEWPFAAKDGYIQSLNATPADNVDEAWDTSSTVAAVTFDVTAKSGDVLAMEYKLQSEPLCDLFVIYVDGKPVRTLSGDWGDSFHSVAVQLTEGKHQVKLAYEKDAYTHTGDDCVCIRDLEVLSGAAGYAALTRNATYPVGKTNSTKVAGDAKAIRLNDPNEITQTYWDTLAEYYGYESLEPQGYYVANGSTVTLNITLAKGFNSETATVTNVYTGDAYLVAPAAKDDGFSLEIPLESIGGTGNLFNYLVVEASNAAGETYSYQCVVFADETNADIFCRSNSMDPENPIEWMYAPTRTVLDYGKNAPKSGTPAKSFTYTDTKGNELTLSSLLKGKKAVILVYGPMNADTLEAYTDLQKAYDQYKDSVSVVAYSTNPLDTAEKLDKLAEANKLTYPIVAGDAKALYDYGAEGVPFTVAIDRNGIAVYSVDTAVPEVLMEALMDYLAADDYKSGAITNLPLTACSVEAPAAADQLKALGNPSGVKIVPNTDKYQWPFVAATAEDGTAYLTTSNTGKHNTEAVLKTEFTAKDGDVLTFDYIVSCEEASSPFLYDYLTVELDGTAIVTASGKTDWIAFDCDLTAGKHTLTFSFVKDYMASGGKDMAGIRNLKVLTGDEAKAFVAARPVYPFADETAVTAVGAAKLNVSDPNGELVQLAGTDLDLFVASANKVTFNITLEEGMKPEHITVVDEDSMEETKLSKLVSKDGSCYTITVEGKNLPYGFGGIEIIDDLTGEYLAFCLVFADEAGLEDFCTMYFGGMQTFTWTMGENVPAPEVPAGEPAPEGYYVVRFVDEEGNPVEGVRVQACNGDLCTITYSDENGEFSVPVADDAHFSVASCPDGLVADTDDHLYEEGYVMIFELQNA